MLQDRWGRRIDATQLLRPGEECQHVMAPGQPVLARHTPLQVVQEFRHIGRTVLPQEDVSLKQLLHPLLCGSETRKDPCLEADPCE